ncbi:MAG: phage tail tape measure protein [Parvibaculaceae bacterium]|nr:phage tail tape measure protein [Parvibaculaceae bacterium]
MSTGKSSKQLGKQAARAAKDVNRLKLKQTEEIRSLGNMRRDLTKAGISTRSLGKAQTQTAAKIKSVTNRLNQQQGALKRATRLQDRHRRASQKYQRTMQRQANVSFVGAAGLATGGAALRGVATTMTPGISFDEQMSAVGAIGRVSKTSKAFAALRAQALELGSTTQFSATEAAAGMEFLVMAGFDATQTIAAMSGMLDLAKAGRTDLAETANIASNILSAFDLDPSKMSMLGDVLTATFTRSNVSLEQLGETMKFTAPAAALVGASVPEAAAMAGLLGNIGIQASMAGTNLRSIYARLASPPSEAAKALKSLGVQTADAAGNLRAVPDILAEIARKTEKMGNAKRLGLFVAIAGQRAGTGFANLVKKGGAGEITKFADVVGNSLGESQRVAKAMADNAAGDIKGLTSAWEGFNIAVGDTQTTPFRTLIQSMTAIVRTGTKWVNENPKLAGTLFTVITAVATLWAVAGGLALAVAGILGPFAMVSFALTTLGLKAMSFGAAFTKLGPLIMWVGKAIVWLGRALLMNPIGLTITAIALGGYLIWKYWEPLTALFKRIFNGFKTDFWGTLSEITAFLINWSPLGLFYKAFAGVMHWFGVELPDTFTGFGGMIIDGLVSGITSAASRLSDAVGNIGDSVKNKFKNVLGIHSPSRVFADFGGNITQGLTVGLQEGQGQPLKALNTMARSMVTPIAMSAAVVPAYAGHPTANQSAAPTEHIEIHIHAGGPSTAEEIAAAVRRELEARDQTRAQAQRSQLYDPE